MADPLIQLAAVRTGTHPVSRDVFRPRPNVDSALVAFQGYLDKGDNRSLGLLKEAQGNALASETLGLHQAYAATTILLRRQQTPSGPLLRSSCAAVRYWLRHTPDSAW